MNENIIAPNLSFAQPAASLDELIQRRNPAAQISVAFTVIEAEAGCAAPSKSYGLAESGKPTVISNGSQPSAGLATRVSADPTGG